MATKVLLRDENNGKLLPITRGELVLDSSGGMALHSDEFLATASQPGLMSPSEKNAINNMKSTVVDDSLSTTSENPVQNKIITQVINETQGLLNGIKEKYLKSASTTPNRLTLVDQDDSEINFHNTTYNVVTNTEAGLAPQIVTATDAIQSPLDEWVLTSKKGETPTWKKLPINAFSNDNSDTTYSINGQLSGNNYIITLKDSSDEVTTAVISPFVGSTDSSDGQSGIVPSPTIQDRLKFLRGDGTWAAMQQVELSWDNILNKPETFKPEAHFHSTSHIVDLQGYNIASDKGSLEESDTLNTALGKLEYKANLGVNAYDWYRSVTGEDTDDIINKWGEIVDFIGGITEDTDILSKFVTTDTAQTITGVKTFSSRISFPANTGIYYNNQSGLLGVASKGQWDGHPGTDKYYTFVGTPSYDTILRAKERLYSYRNGQLYEVLDAGNLSSITKLHNFYSERQTSLKPAIIGDGSMYQFKSTYVVADQTDDPGEGHILHFEWDNDGGYSSQLFIQNHDGLLKTRGMNGKDANGNAKWSNWVQMINTNDILLKSRLLFGPNKTDIQPTTLNNNFLHSPVSIVRGLWAYADNGYTSTPFGNIDLAGTTVIKVGANDSEFTQLFITPPTATETNALRGELLYYIDNGSSYYPTWYRVITNSNYSNYTLPRLESMQFAKNSTYVNATLVDPEVRKLAQGNGYIEFWDSAVSPNTNGYFNSVWGKIRTKFGYESESKISLLGTTADTSWISFNRTGEGANYITWPGESSAQCLLAFGYGNQYAQSYYYMSNKALYPATNNTRSLGTSTMKWLEVHASTVYGKLIHNTVGTWIYSAKNPAVMVSGITSGSAGSAFTIPVKDGYLSVQSLLNSNTVYFNYFSTTKYDANTNELSTAMRIDASLGNFSAKGSIGTDAKGGGAGVSLYGGAGNTSTHGIAFNQTSSWGKHGQVTGDWATYFTMSNTDGRGWIFRRSGVGPVASIDTKGNVTATTFNGDLNGTASSTLRFKTILVGSSTTKGKDLNTELSGGGIARNYYSYLTDFANAPTGAQYGSVLEINTNNGTNQSLSLQLAWDVNHANTTDTTRYLWWRTADETNKFTYSKWHRVADFDKTLVVNKGISLTDSSGGVDVMTPDRIFAQTGEYSLTKTQFYYERNGYTTATKPNGTTMVNLDLAGASILTFGASSAYTQLFITAPAQSGHSGITNEMLFYQNHGSSYSPGWTRVLTNRNYKSIVVGEAGFGTSDFSDGTEILTSYASDSGFSSAGYVNEIYKRKASSMFNYIKTKAAVDANAFTSYTSKYLKVYTKSDSQSYPLLFAGGLGSSGGTDRGIYTASVNTLYYNPSNKLLSLPSGSRINSDGGSLYLGNSNNAGWVCLSNMCAKDGPSNWYVYNSGKAYFKGIAAGTAGLSGWYKDTASISIDISTLRSVYYIENKYSTTISFTGTANTSGKALLFVYSYHTSGSKTYTINGEGISFGAYTLRVFLVSVTDGSTTVSITKGTALEGTR